ncbi:hypothetical protein [Streptomyces sp. NPDC006996]|uniref:hypothetical protein n=1 Tax=Streptomyces sp. NPDC006996 TaxID=3156908 RepID=UPI0033E2F7A0
MLHGADPAPARPGPPRPGRHRRPRGYGSLRSGRPEGDDGERRPARAEEQVPVVLGLGDTKLAGPASAVDRSLGRLAAARGVALPCIARAGRPRDT